MHSSNVEMAWKYNGIYKLCEVLAVILFVVPVIYAENIDCYGKSFYCVNSTHFMICVDIGGSSSSTVDNFIIECPPSTECHISNNYECEFPSSTILTTDLQSGDVANENEFGYYGITTKSPWASTDTTMVLAPKYDERPYSNLQDIRAGKSAYIESYFDTPTIKPKYEEYSKIANEGTVTPTATPSTVEMEYLSEFKNEGKYTTALPNFNYVNANRPAITNENEPETNTEVTPRLSNITKDFMLVIGQDTVKKLTSFENYFTKTNDSNWESTVFTNNNSTTTVEKKDLPLNIFDKMSEVEFIQSKPDSNSGSLQISQKYSETPVATIPTYPIKINTEGTLNNNTEYGMFNTQSTMKVTDDYNVDMLPNTYNEIKETLLTTETNEFLNIPMKSNISVLSRNNVTGVDRVDSIKNLRNVIEEAQSSTPDILAFTEKEATSPHLQNTDLLEIIKVKPVDTGKDLKSSNPVDVVNKNKQLNLSDGIENLDETGLTKMIFDLVNIKKFDDTATNKSEHDSLTNIRNIFYNTNINDLKTSFNQTEIENANIDEIEKVKSLPILTDSVFENNTQNIQGATGTLKIEPAQKLNLSTSDTYNLSAIAKQKNNAPLQEEPESALDMDEHNQAEIAFILSNNSKVWYEEMNEKRQEILSELESKNTLNLTVINKNQMINRDNTKIIKKTFTMEPVIDVQASIKPNLDIQENSTQKSNENTISSSNLSVSIDNSSFSEIRVATPSYRDNAINSSDYSTHVEAEAIKSNKPLRETRSNSKLENTTPKVNNETMSPDNENLVYEAFDEENTFNENYQTDLNTEKFTNVSLSDDTSLNNINYSNKTLDNEETEFNNKSTFGIKNKESAQSQLFDSTEPAKSAKKTVDEEVNELNENSLFDKHTPDHIVASTEQANKTIPDKTLKQYLSPHPSSPGLDIITLNSFDESNQTRPTRTLSPENSKNITENVASNATSNKDSSTDDSNPELSSRVQNVSSIVPNSKNVITAQPIKNDSSNNEAKNQNIHNGYPVTSTVTATPTSTQLDNTTFSVTPDLATGNTNEQTHSTWTPSSTMTTSSSDSITKEVLVEKSEKNSNLTNITNISKPSKETKTININNSQKSIHMAPRDEKNSKTNENISDQKAKSPKTDIRMKKIIDILLESLYFSSNDKLAKSQNNIPTRTFNNGFIQSATFTPTATQTNTETCKNTAQTTPSVTFDASSSYMPTSSYSSTTPQQEYDDITFTQTPKNYYNRQTARMAVINAGGLPMFTTTAMSESSSYSTSNHFHCPRNVRGKFADKNNCRLYYTCFGDMQPVVGVCPSNTVFSEVNKLCTKNLSHCMKYNIFKCNSEGRFSDYIKNNVYYICVKGRKSFYKLQFQCSLGYRLDKKSVRCVIDHSGNGDDPASSTESISNSKSDLVAQESRQYSRVYKHKNNSHRQFQCVEEGNFADPRDKTCRVYYECKKTRNNFRRVKRKCESDELFDKDSDMCVDAESYECGNEK